MVAKIIFFKQLSNWTDRATQFFSIVLLITMLSISLTAIFSQIFLDDPISWGYSLTRLFLPWIALMSITVTLKAGEHIAINFLIKMLPEKLSVWAEGINRVVILAFGLGLIWYGIGFFLNSTQTFMVSDTLQVSHKWTAASVPLMGVIITIHIIGGLSLSNKDEVMESLEMNQGKNHG